MKKTMNFDFVGKRKVFYIISLLLIVIGIVFNIVNGTLLDIQFSGGTMVSYSYNGSLDSQAIKTVVEETIGEAVNVTNGVDSQSGKNFITVTLVDSKSLPSETLNAVLDAINKASPDSGFELRNTTSVSPSVGKDFLAKGIMAVIIASIFMIIYIGIRFRKMGGLSAGAMAVVALLHDVAIAYFTFVVFRIPINDNFIAVVLTILGYSLNGTIVIYDRIRENDVLKNGKLDYPELVNLSVNQSFARCINTALCTFAAVMCVVVVALVNGLDSIISFAIPMAAGVVSGFYSSTCLAGILWASFMSRGKKSKKKG